MKETRVTTTAVIMKADEPNGIGHIYTTAQIQDMISTQEGKILYGQIGMPSSGSMAMDLGTVSHMASNLRLVDGELLADIETMDTPAGHILGSDISLFEFRTTGLGRVLDDGTITEYTLTGINAVPAESARMMRL